jgi:PAS domain S-box-containing protein
MSLHVPLSRAKVLQTLATYAGAVVAAVAAFYLRQALEQLVGGALPHYVIFYPTIMLIAIFAGQGPGILATSVAALLAAYFILPPTGFGIIYGADALGLALFCGMGMLMSLLAGRYRRLRDRLEEQVAERTVALEKANQELFTLNSELMVVNEEHLVVNEELQCQGERLTDAMQIAQDKEERLRLALDAADMATWDWHVPSGKVIWNSKHFQMLGYLPDEITPSYDAWISRVHPDDVAVTSNNIQHSMEQHEGYVAEFRTVWPDGTIRWLEARGSFTYDTEGRPYRSFGVMLDTTGRKEAERKLLRALNRLDLAQRASQAGIWEWDIDSGQLIWSEELFHLFGLSPAQDKASFDSWSKVIHPEDLSQAEALLREAVATGSRLESDYRIILPSGETRWINAIGETSYNNAGQPQTMSGICLDITGRKQMENVLRFLGVCGTDPSGEGFFQELSRYLAQTLNMEFICIDLLEKGNLAARTLAVFHDGQFEDNVSYFLEDTPCGKVVGQRICCFPDNVRGLFPKDEVLQDLQAESYLGTTLWSSQGEPIGLIAVIGRHPLADTRLAEAILQLVSVRAAGELERQLTEEALRQSELQIRLLIEHAPAALAMFDREMRYLCASQRWLSDYNLGDRDLTGVSHYEVFPEISGTWREFHQRALAGEVLHAEADRFERADGSVQWLRWEIRPWQDISGAIGGIIIFSDDITDIKKAEDILRRYELLADHSRDIIIFVRNDDGQILEANAAAMAKYGYGREELLGLKIMDLRAPEAVALTATQMAEADAHGILFETMHRRKDGSTFPVEVSSQGSTIGGVRTLISIIRDISERRQAEAALKEHELKASALINAANESIWLFGLQGDILAANTTAARRLGMTVAEVLGRKWVDLIPPALVASRSERLDFVLATGCTVHAEDERAGIIFAHTYYPVRDESGEILSIACFSRDITEIKQAEEKLRQQRMELEAAHAAAEKERRLLAAVMEALPTGVAITDEKGGCIQSNRAYETVWSGPCPQTQSVADYAEYKAWWDDSGKPLAPGEWASAIAINLGRSVSGQVLKIRRFDGSFATVINSAAPILDNEGSILGSAVAIHDISDLKRAEIALQQANRELEERVAARTHDLQLTIEAIQKEIVERKEAEKALRISEERYALAVEGANDGIWDWDLELEVAYVSPRWKSMLGYGRDELANIVNDWISLIHPDDFSGYVLFFERYLAGEIPDYQYEYRLRHKDGSYRWILTRGTCYRNADGRPYRMAGSHTDISERKSAEERLLRLNRLYQVLSETGLAIIRNRDKDAIFADICRIAVVHGGFRLAWIGMVNELDLVDIVAAYGVTSYLDGITISVRDEPSGRGPTGLVFRHGGHYICNDFQSDPCTAPWHERAHGCGLFASASAAISINNRIIGALTLYAGEKNYFDNDMEELLKQITSDISFALEHFEQLERRSLAESALHEEAMGRLRALEELREKEQMLIQQNRLAAMGEMMNNIAHQWRQPLNMLGLNIQRLAMFYGTDQFDREFLLSSTTSAMNNIRHMSRTIDDFRNFFKTEREKTEFNVSNSVQQTISLVNDSFKEDRIEIVTRMDDSLVIFGHPNEFSQVLLNILQNSRDAIRERQVENGQVTITSHGENGRVILIINDNAGGIDPAILDRIFEPYFSTKGVQGTGIGLFMSKNIIESSMGGAISARNVAEGSEFRIEV